MGVNPVAELTVAAIKTKEDILQARRLLRDYGASIAGTVCAEGFEEECNALDSVYGPPTGAFLLLRIRATVQAALAFGTVDQMWPR